VSHSPRVAAPIVRAGRRGVRRPAEPLCPGGDRDGVEEVPGSAGSDGDGVFSEAKGTKTPIRPLDWHFASTLGHHPPWPAPCPTSGCAGSSALSSHPVGPGRTETSRSWCPGTRCASSTVNFTDVGISPSRSGDPRSAQPPAASNPVAVLPGHPRPLLRWLQEAAKHKWRRWRKQRGPGRPPMSDALVRLIGGLGRENRRQGCVRIQGELRKLRMVTSKSRTTRISST